MIRATTFKDISAVQHIAQISWKDTYKKIIPDDIQTLFLEKAYSKTMLMKRIEKTILLLAESEGIPVGFANFTYVDEDGDAELTAIYVLPDYQRMGYGNQLLQAGLIEIAKGQQLFVYVESENKPARVFYETFGFECLEEFDEHFEGHPLSTAKYVFPLNTPTY